MKNLLLLIGLVLACSLQLYSQNLKIISIDVYATQNAVNINGLVRPITYKSNIAVSPDRKYIALAFIKPQHTEGHILEKGIYLYDKTQKELVLLNEIAPGTKKCSIDWSPSGRQFLVSLTTGHTKLLFDTQKKVLLDSLQIHGNKYLWNSDDSLLYQYRQPLMNKKMYRNNGYAFGIKQRFPGSKEKILFTAKDVQDIVFDKFKGENLYFIRKEYISVKKHNTCVRPELTWKEVFVLNRKLRIIKKYPVLTGTVTVKSVSLRVGPSFKSKKTALLKKNRQVVIIDRGKAVFTGTNSQSYWYKIRIKKNVIGWCLGRFLELK